MSSCCRAPSQSFSRCRAKFLTPRRNFWKAVGELTDTPEPAIPRRCVVPKRRVLLEELQLSVLIPNPFSAAEVRAANRVLGSRRFQQRLRSSLESLLRSYPALVKVRIAVSR